ncbi:hypothetical protein [Plantibacter sp. YIM 135347]|uniref:hypothetical protein n=1 Tax=Plantibacter sp. YIM 135347 TaxID=3423919 RepID=UPI003D33760A
MDVHDLIGLILEVFTWIGLGSAVVVLVIMLIARAADGTWVETHAVIVDGVGVDGAGVDRARVDGDASPDPDPDVAPKQLRWMTEESELYSRDLTDAEAAAIRDPDEAIVYYSRRDPSLARFGRRAEHAKALRLLFFVTAGVGVGSFIASFIVLFTE